MGKSKRKGKFTPQDQNFTPKKNDEKTFLASINATVKKLPSKGLSYPANVEIRYRPYAYGEVKQISQSKMSEKDLYGFIMDGIDITGMDKGELTLGDAMYLAVYRKVSTLGTNKITVKYKCGGCSKESSTNFETREIKPKFIEAPRLPMKIELETAPKPLSFKPLTIGQYFEVQDKIRLNTNLDMDMALIAFMADGDFEEIYDILYNLTSQNDIGTLKEIDRYLNHGLDSIKGQCTNPDEKGTPCGHVTDIELDGGQALLLPFREDEEPTRSRISFGD